MLIAFPTAHADSVSRKVVASNREDVNLRHGRSYEYLEAKRGGEISGRKNNVKGQAGELVNANSGGEIKLKDANIEASRASRLHDKEQGPAVSATGSHQHGHRGHDSVVKLEDGKVTTHNNNSPALRASQQGGKIYADGTELRTRGTGSDVVQALDGGQVFLRGTEIASEGRDSDGVKVYGRGASASVDRSRILTRGRDADGVSVKHGGIAVVSKSSIQTSGRSADGISVSGERSLVVGDSLKISTKGENSHGVDVEDGGTLLLSRGDVESKGKDGRGVAIDDGGRAVIVGSKVSASGDRGIALHVDDKDSQAIVIGSRLQSSGRSGQAVLIEDGADALIAGSTIVADGLGVQVQGKGSQLIGLDVDIDAESEARYRQSREPALGLRVEDQAKALLVGGSIQAKGDQATGVSVGGSGSLVFAAGTDIRATGDDSTGMRVSRDARAILVGSDIQGGGKGLDITKGGQAGTVGGTVTATDARGVALSVSGRDSVAATIGTNLTADGQDGVAVEVRDAGRAYLIDSSLNARAVGLRAEGKDASVVSVGSSITAGTEIVPVGRAYSEPAVGVASDTGATVILIGGDVTALGDNSVAAQATSGDMLIAGTKIGTSGTNATAVLAQQPEQDGKRGRDWHATSSRIAVIGSTVSTTGAEAAAVKADGKRSEILVAKSAVNTAGQGSHGVVVQDGGKVALVDSTVQVSGEQTAAARVQSEVSRYHRSVSELYINGTTLAATGENSAGIELDNSANVYLQESTVSATGASLVSTLSQRGQTQNITVGNGANLVENNGTLLQVNRSGDSGSSKVNLDLQDGSVTAGNIVDDLAVPLSGNGGTYVKLGALATYDGKMIGVREVTTEGGNQKINFEGGSTIGNLSIDNKAVTSGGTTAQRILAEGDVTIDDATLGGNWKIDGKLTSKNGGIVKPGNSVGTVSTAGIDWQAGTVYQAEINEAGQSDLVEVTGPDSADIANSSLVVSEENGAGRFRLNQDYTVLTAAGGVQGEFVSADWTGTAYPLIAMDTLYSDNAVAVRMGVNRQALSTMDFTSNQRATGFGAASVAGANATVDEAFFSSDPAQAFDQLSGEVHATARSLVFADMLSTNAALQSQMRANLGATLLPGQPMAASDGTPAGAQPKSASYPLWVRFNAASINNDGDGNTASAHYSTTRLLVGADAGIGGGWRLGAAGGASTGDFNVKDRSSDGTINNYTFALYGGNSWILGPGKLNLLLGGGYTRHNIDTDRNVSLGAGQELSADYHGSTWQLFGDLGYAIPWGETHHVEPYVNVSWFNQRMSGFSESGGDAALSSSASTAKLSSYTLGLRSALVFPGKTNAFTVRTNLGWRHAGGDRSPTRSMQFIEGAGSAFSIAGAPIAKNSLLVGLSGEVSLDSNFAMGLSYDGEFGSGNADNAGSLFMKVRF
ncbi:autotransporter outer membrane beta-barrel domain-containing protein [Bordetella petrii]|uniref:autotransporter outer membrane beta-barrel domain-containing protein n=1 Tax=Bordetella petrii TaxID=94624 RepID=UPI001248E081|nr:autotransporter outer membrane beta-barrel domain-containing protein [Bordetella petrii]